MRHLITLATLLIAPSLAAEPVRVAQTELPDESFVSLTAGCLSGRELNACVLLGLAHERGGELLGVHVTPAPLSAEYYYRRGCDRGSSIACHLGAELLAWWSQDSQMPPQYRKFAVPALPDAASEAISLAGRACELWATPNPTAMDDNRSNSCLAYADACHSGLVPPTETCRTALDFESRWHAMREYEPTDGLITM